MTTHPATLWAASNCWSLRRAWAAARNTNTSDTRDGIRSPVYGTRTSSGGHGDPTGDHIAADVDHHTNTARTIDEVRANVDQAWWLLASATRDTPMPTGPALAVMSRLIPACDPATAHEVTGYLDRADRALRRTLRLGDDHWPIPENPACPACGVRMLRARTSNPDSAQWPVICAAGCLCIGETCPCGMDVRQKRTVHIWPAAWATRTLDLTATEMEATTA
ncbi:hypothetical protein ACIA5A_05925 [Micromonospora sp. NPDC051300]|uniref:hypothetical protein n=1 Tax=Micromonospora sp. NPDC051300 TaxID=3364286 RepID=UPI0037B09CF3